MSDELAFPGTDDGRTVADFDAEIKAQNAAIPATTKDLMNFEDLPAIGQPLDAGIFAGLTTTPAGDHCAVVLLADKPAQLMTWQQAIEWATSIGGVLPARPVSALLFAQLWAHFEIDDEPWYWTSEQSSAHYAWVQRFLTGSQLDGDKSAELRARAVRLIQLTA